MKIVQISLSVSPLLDALLGLVGLTTIFTFYDAVRSAAILKTMAKHPDIEQQATALFDRTLWGVLPISVFCVTLAMLFLYVPDVSSIISILLSAVIAGFVGVLLWYGKRDAVKTNFSRGKIKGIGWLGFGWRIAAQTVIVSLLVARGAIGLYMLFEGSTAQLAGVRIHVTLERR